MTTESATIPNSIGHDNLFVLNHNNNTQIDFPTAPNQQITSTLLQDNTNEDITTEGVNDNIAFVSQWWQQHNNNSTDNYNV